MKRLSVTEAACQIGVSTATVRNWVKGGHLKPLSGERLSFDEGEILRIKADLATGRFGRLRNRANKTKSDTQVVPVEYAEKSNLSGLISQWHRLQASCGRSKETLLFLTAVRLLERAGDVDGPLRASSRRCFDQLTWRRNCVGDEMRRWHATLPRKPDCAAYHEIAKQIDDGTQGNGNPENSDDLGLLYQTLFLEGDKSRAGSYYTPTQYVRDALQWAGIKAEETLLDPCCGTGKYLVTAMRRFALRPENCCGFDIDPLAVRLARVNLFLVAPNCEFVPNIFCCDALSSDVSHKLRCCVPCVEAFDIIATNPPWGADRNANRPTNEMPHFRESFALFLLKSLSLLKVGGRLSFLLPESFFNIKKHAEIRKLVLTQTAVHSVVELGRGFSGVYTGAIRLDAVKGRPRPRHRCHVTNVDGHSYEIEQSVFLRNRDCMFDIKVTPADRVILEKIFATPHITLANNAEWALGIVTGNNAKHIVKTPVEGFEPVFRGSDVEPYRLRRPTQYMRFEPALYQQVAPEMTYRTPEKLVYKFISKKLVFALDTQGRLTLNSANVLIPRLAGMNVKVVAAFLNSTLFQYVFEKKFTTHKVLRGDLERLPFPVISPEMHDAILAHVETLIAQQSQTSTVPSNHQERNELEPLIFACFPDLTNEDIKHITNTSEKNSTEKQ